MLMKAQQDTIVSLTVQLLMVKLQTMEWEILQLMPTYLGTVGDFFEKFKDQGYITKTAAEGKQLEIRMVCEEDRFVCNQPVAALSTMLSSLLIVWAQSE